MIVNGTPDRRISCSTANLLFEVRNACRAVAPAHRRIDEMRDGPRATPREPMLMPSRVSVVAPLSERRRHGEDGIDAPCARSRLP